jgi:DNA-binding XRE family transcriptional regulator
MTLQQLAQKVGTTAQTIQRLETDNMTVSLDWLERIAVVFGMPAAALLMSETTTGIPVLGDVNSSGQITVSVASPLSSLALVLAVADPVAIRTQSTLHASVSDRVYEPDTMLIGGKIDSDAETVLPPQDCIVAFTDGRMAICRAAIEAGRIVLSCAKNPLNGFHDNTGKSEAFSGEAEWVAPILMAVRYC